MHTRFEEFFKQNFHRFCCTTIEIYIFFLIALATKNFLNFKRFVKLFRSKTPKITLFDNEFKHVLMESGDFYCSQGPRLIFIGCTDNRMHIYEREEKICTIPAGNDSEPLISVPSKFRLIVSMARAGQKRILDIEEILSKTNCPVFPAILGRNCAKNFENKTLTIINESLNLVILNKSSSWANFKAFDLRKCFKA